MTRRARRPPAVMTAVQVDRRGYIYLTDKNHGLYVLRYEGLAGAVVA